ncbi:MAG: cell division protein FtsL [Aquisalimonadaceae bacterium]
MNAQILIGLALAGALTVSALGVVYSKHESRQLFAELEELNRTRDALNAEWGMLQLEQGAWATHGRVERIASERLDMTLPGGGDVIILRR